MGEISEYFIIHLYENFREKNINFLNISEYIFKYFWKMF